MVELYRDGQRVARRRNLNMMCGAPAVARFSSLTAAEAGSWTGPFPWPVVAIHLSLLPDGKVLSWGLTGQPQVWDPASGQFTEVASQAELFCSGHSLLADGRVLVTGGHISSDHGIPDISIFNPANNTWTQSTPMRRGRWYPTNTTLANGSVVILAGRDEVGDEVAEPEVWTPNGVRQLDNASLVLPYYPRTFVAPNGQVFYAGEQQTSRYLSTSGSGSWTVVGERKYGARPYGAAVMYEAGKILYVGGGRTTNTAEIIDLNTAVTDLAVDRLDGLRPAQSQRHGAADRRGVRDGREQLAGVRRRVAGHPGHGDVEPGHRRLDHDDEQRDQADVPLDHLAAS